MPKEALKGSHVWEDRKRNRPVQGGGILDNLAKLWAVKTAKTEPEGRPWFQTNVLLGDKKFEEEKNGNQLGNGHPKMC